MTVELLAYTETTYELDVKAQDPDSEPADSLAEFAGRECYQSFDRPNAATASNDAYLANIIAKQHTSVLAHASFTFRLTGVSRSLTHELIRSRFLAFSELSQRYVNMEDSYTVVPPLFRGDEEPGVFKFGEVARDQIEKHHYQSVALYAQLVELAEGKGATHKEARQAARCVLPGGTETKIVVSGNLRAWRDFIAQRWTKHADDEIREVAGEILTILREYAPNSVQDIPEVPSE